MASYTPTTEMAKNAEMALKVRQSKPDSQKGMTAVGLARARDIMNRRPLSEETVRRMKAYFDRHEIDKQGSTWRRWLGKRAQVAVEPSPADVKIDYRVVSGDNKLS